MVVATRQGDAVELPRAPYDDWTHVRQEFRRDGRRGYKVLAMLALRLGHGFTCREIAEVTGLSEGHVRREIRRARDRVKKTVTTTKKRARERGNC